MGSSEFKHQVQGNILICNFQGMALILSQNSRAMLGSP